VTEVSNKGMSRNVPGISGEVLRGAVELCSTGQIRTSAPMLLLGLWWPSHLEDEMVGAVGFEPTTSTV
jgi:hypothetical protein